jgi:quercetin dioxygenase-like cupin family protein
MYYGAVLEAKKEIPVKERSVKKVNFLLLATVAIYLLSAPLASAQTAHKVVRVEDVKWIDHPIFKGAKTAILVGDPTKAEVIVQRVKFPPHYRVPPHTHPYAEVVTVLTGSYGNYFGEKFEPKGELMKPGSLFVLPANHPHYTWTGDEETILQVQFMGPGGVEFIDPADDPRKK